MTRTIAITVATIALVGGLAGAGIFAYFSNSAGSAENEFVAGTVSIGSPGPFPDEVFTVGDLKPGNPPVSYTFTVYNEGTLPAWYGAYYEKSDSLWTCDANDEDPRGSYELMVAAQVTDPGEDPPNYVEAGESEGFTVYVYLPPEADNDCQDLTGELTIRFISFQAEYSSYVHLENREAGIPIVGDGIFGDVRYLDDGTSLMGLLVAEGLTPWRQYQLRLVGPNDGGLFGFEDQKLSTACPDPGMPLPGFEPGIECDAVPSGNPTEGYYNFDMGAATNGSGELNIAFDVSTLASGTYQGVRLRVNEATQFSTPPYKTALWEDGQGPAKPDTLQFTIRP